MKNYFENCKTIEEVKKQYKNLAKKNHPDMGGNEEIMKDINNQYDVYINKLKDSKSEPRANEEVKEAKIYKDLISELIKYNDINLELCGWFLWVDGNTKPIKKELKNLGFYWASKKLKWYYKPDWYKCRSRGNWSMEEIRKTHGSEKIKKTSKKKGNPQLV